MRLYDKYTNATNPDDKDMWLVYDAERDKLWLAIGFLIKTLCQQAGLICIGEFN